MKTVTASTVKAQGFAMYDDATKLFSQSLDGRPVVTLVSDLLRAKISDEATVRRAVAQTVKSLESDKDAASFYRIAPRFRAVPVSLIASV